MNTSDFDYHLPPEQIAQKSVEPRDHSKLCVVDRKTGDVSHKQFFDIVQYFQKGDVLVWNNSKVFKARLFGEVLSGTGRELRGESKPVEIFLVRPMENMGVWKVLARPGKRVLPGTRVSFAPDFSCEVMIKEKDGTILVQFADDEDVVREKANKYGHIPIPPYVEEEPQALEQYQTVYAAEEKEGSVAAPTAGFHFTDAIIEQLKEKGVIFADVTLHVGLGTFLPVKAEKLDEHKMHSEWVEIGADTAEIINTAKKEGRRVIAVGTTSVRTLEGVAAIHPPGYAGDHIVREFEGDIDIFITPGFEFQVIDALITNFHLPKSTLLMLVSAFIGDREKTLDIYQEAVDKGYRFFSFGDAMFIMHS